MCFSHFITYVIHLNLLPGLTLYALHKTLEISVMLWEVYEEGLNHMCIHYYMIKSHKNIVIFMQAKRIVSATYSYVTYYSAE